jgi:hypothetical protein
MNVATNMGLVAELTEGTEHELHPISPPPFEDLCVPMGHDNHDLPFPVSQPHGLLLNDHGSLDQGRLAFWACSVGRTLQSASLVRMAGANVAKGHAPR